MSPFPHPVDSAQADEAGKAQLHPVNEIAARAALHQWERVGRVCGSQPLLLAGRQPSGQQDDVVIASNAPWIGRTDDSYWVIFQPPSLARPS
jgi:hypothetical protein